MNEHQAFEAIAEGVEYVSSLIARYAMLEALYLHASSAARQQLYDALVRLYTSVLEFLSRAIRHYGRGAGGKIKFPGRD